ncbi:hypothetical protein BC835DRAFT_1283280, partial [Cytidiella melzeri]
KDIKLGTPIDFEGDRSTTEDFLHQIMLHFDFWPNAFPDNKRKIIYTLSFMKKGKAAL